MTNVDTVSTYFSSHNVGGGNIVTTGALNSGSITSGFGNINTGSSTITTTGAVATGAVTAGGVLKTDDTTEATSTTDGSLQTDGGLSVAKDVVAGDDIKLLSDASVIAFGANGDVTLTHVHDTGLLLNSTMQLQFNDASQNINAPSATVLDINATDEIELNATLLDVNANINASGTYTGAGLMTTGGNIVIPDAGNIGSASDTNAISISSGGVVAVTATTANTSASDGALTVAGGLGVAADASIGDDLRLISDGAIITMGANSEINLTHVHDTGITTNGELTSTVIRARKPIKTEFNASGAVTASLTAAESGATVLIHGTENNVINLPAAATTNPGLYYDFIVLTAVGGGTSTIVNIAGSGGQFVGSLSLAGGTAANAVFDNAGDAFTFIASTVVGSRARITCLTDDGTDGVWQVESVASPIATID